MSNYSPDRIEGKHFAGPCLDYMPWKVIILQPKSEASVNNSLLYIILISFTEILLDSPRLHKGMHKLWRIELVSLENCRACAIGSVSDCRRFRLSPERLVHCHRLGRNQHSEHLQAILYEVGLQDYVLERV